MIEAFKPFRFIFFFCLFAQVILTLFEFNHSALSIGIGGSLAALIQYWSTVFARAILLKKSVAIALAIIVFKYAIFGIILSFYASDFRLEPIGFLTGFISLFPSLFFLGQLRHQFLNHRVRV